MSLPPKVLFFWCLHFFTLSWASVSLVDTGIGISGRMGVGSGGWGDGGGCAVLALELAYGEEQALGELIQPERL